MVRRVICGEFDHRGCCARLLICRVFLASPHVAHDVCSTSVQLQLRLSRPNPYHYHCHYYISIMRATATTTTTTERQSCQGCQQQRQQPCLQRRQHHIQWHSAPLKKFFLFLLTLIHLFYRLTLTTSWGQQQPDMGELVSMFFLAFFFLLNIDRESTSRLQQRQDAQQQPTDEPPPTGAATKQPGTPTRATPKWAR